MTPKTDVGPNIPEVLGIGEDRSNIPRRSDRGRVSPADVLSIYFEGGPRYRLGSQIYCFTPPIGILIPEGVLDDDLQESRVHGIYALFRSHGLLRPVRGAGGTRVAVSAGGR